MPDPVTCILGYLAIGAAIWALMDPVAYADFVTRAWLRKRGVLPSRGWLLVSVVLAVLLWPKVVMIFVRGMRA